MMILPVYDDLEFEISLKRQKYYSLRYVKDSTWQLKLPDGMLPSQQVALSLDGIN